MFARTISTMACAAIAVWLSAPAAIAGGPVDAPGIRAAVFYSIDNGGVIVRSRGIEKVTNPSLGLYCVKVKANSKIKNAKITVPMVSVEAEHSKGMGANSVAVVATNGSDCPNPRRWITVRTFSTAGSPTDDAAWTLMVP